MSTQWNPRQIIMTLSKEEFKEWCIENRNNLKEYIDSLAEDPAQYHAFEQFILTEYDLRTWNNLIDSLGDPTCKPAVSLKYRDLVGKPNLNGAVIIDDMKLVAGSGVTIDNPVVVVDPVTGLKTTSIKINADALADGNVGYDSDTSELYVKESGTYVPITTIKTNGNTLATEAQVSNEESARITADANLQTKIDGKISLLGPEKYSGEQYHFPFNFDAKYEDGKIKVGLDTITLDNNKTIVHYDKELSLPNADVDKAYVDAQDAKKMDLLGKVPGTEQVYRLPYFFSTTPSSTKVTVTANTVTLDNKKQQETFSLDVDSATKSLAGLMSATDKTKLDGIDLTNYALKSDLSSKADSFSVDNTTIEMSTDRKLSAKIPAAVKFKGKVNSTSDLPTSGQVAGDMYYVGTAAPYDIHIWNGSAWVAAGTSSVDVSDKADKNNTILTGTGTFENLSTTGELKIDKNGTFKVDDNAIVEGVVRSLGNEAYSGQPYHIPYHMVLTPSADKVTATAYTITLDNTKSLNNYAFDLTSATTSNAGLMSSSDKTKLNGLAEQVQADWSETTTTSKAYIKNKPTPVSTISSSSTVTEFASAKAVYDYIESLDGNGTSY